MKQGLPSTIRVDVEDRVAVVTLNRPDRLNAYTPQMGAELFGTFHDLDKSGKIRAIIVTGEGRAFCAGADLASGGDTFAGERDGRGAAHRSQGKAVNLATPIIGAINGPAVGIGATLPLYFDIRLASDRARIGFIFTRRGIIPEYNSTWALPRLIGMSKAMELMVTGRILDAPEALAYGLVSRVVPHDDLLRVARELARDIADNTSPVAVGITKELLWRQQMEPDPRRAKEFEDTLFHWIGAQPDAAEGVTAFLEKRRPEWKMSVATDMPDELEPLDE